jgi:hypothetical protein
VISAESCAPITNVPTGRIRPQTGAV